MGILFLYTRAPVVYAGDYKGTLVAVYVYNGDPCVREGLFPSFRSLFGN